LESLWLTVGRTKARLDQIEDTVTDGVLTARARLPVGDGVENCVECGDQIPEARRKALPGARTCWPASPTAIAASFRPASTDEAARTVSCADVF
jgi:hypothetical protein